MNDTYLERYFENLLAIAKSSPCHNCKNTNSNKCSNCIIVPRGNSRFRFSTLYTKFESVIGGQ